MTPLETHLQAKLAEAREAGLQRQRRVVTSPCGPRLTVEGRDYLAFASNDYLGLAHHPDIIQALCDGTRQWGAGSGASHLVSGHLQPHETLADALAAHVGIPKALTFSTGYLANLAIIPALVGRGDAVFADKLNHASLIDAVQLSRAESLRYPHGDLETLADQLARSTAKTKLIVTDAVFSMDGDIAPLQALLALAERHDAWLVVDDAHGFGVLGPRGAGTLAHLGIAYQPRLLLMGTLGKAAGVSGAFVAGSDTAIQWLVQSARSYIFTTAAPPGVACALLRSLEIIAQDDARRQHLQALIQQLQAAAPQLPGTLLPSGTAIQALVVGDNHTALQLSRQLQEHGLWVPAIRPPTVPKGSARLRISLSAAHRHEDVDTLIHALKAASP